MPNIRELTNVMQQEAPKETNDGAVAGRNCINHNSAGGTCNHWEKEHGGPGGGCMLCDCDSFIPNG
jgi:hypothetical protein